MTTIKGVISHNVDESKFKQMLMFPLYFMNSKKILYDFSEVKFIDNIHLRYITEILPRNIGKIDEKSFFFIISERLMQDFIHSKINRYVRFISPVEYSNEEKSAPIKTDAQKINEELLKKASEINKLLKPLNVLQKPIILDTKSIAQIDIAKKILKSETYLLLNKIYETEEHENNFKEQLLKLTAPELSIKKILLDAGSLEFLSSKCIVFLKRFIYLCKSNNTNIKIINLKKNIADYLIRQKIPLEEVS